MSSWNIGKLMAWTIERFNQIPMIETPRLDAQLLLAHALKLDRIQLYMYYDKPVTPDERALFRGLVQRRLTGEPIAYITQEKNWGDLTLFVDARVLVPRPETEILFQEVCTRISQNQDSGRFPETLTVLDLCTGSGCLALAFAKQFPKARVLGVDICPLALEVAQINSTKQNLNVEWGCGDVTDSTWLAAFLRAQNPDVVVSNPPYVREEEWEQLSPSVKGFEPKKALVCKDLGLWVARCIASVFFQHNTTSLALLAMELASGQPQILMNELKQGSVLRDWDGNPRFYFSHINHSAQVFPI